jgi:drug/metabolite transporter (DMT)-like permease
MKKGMSIIGPIQFTSITQILNLLISLFTNTYILIGVLMSIITTLSWMVTLTKTQLSFAYPFISLAFPLVLIFSSILFQEQIPLSRWIGVIVILVGVLIVSKN